MLRLISKRRFRVSTPIALAAAVTLGLSTLAGFPENRTQDLHADGDTPSHSRQATSASSADSDDSRKNGLKISLMLFRRG
jgi:hypothetical protein